MRPIEESDTSTRGHSCDEYPPNDPAIRRYLAGQSQPSKLTVAASGPPVVDVSGRPAAAGSHSDSQERGLSRAGSNIHGYRAPADQHKRNRADIPNKPTSSFHPQATHSECQHAASREPFWEPTHGAPGGTAVNDREADISFCRPALEHRSERPRPALGRLRIRFGLGGVGLRQPTSTGRRSRDLPRQCVAPFVLHNRGCLGADGRP